MWRKGWRMSCDVGEVTERLENELCSGLENELWRRWSDARGWRMRLCPLSNPSVASPTSQIILQSFRRFTYVTAHFPTLPSLRLCQAHSPALVASPTTQALHIRHLASRPCIQPYEEPFNKIVSTEWIHVNQPSIEIRRYWFNSCSGNEFWSHVCKLTGNTGRSVLRNRRLTNSYHHQLPKKMEPFQRYKQNNNRIIFTRKQYSNLYCQHSYLIAKSS